MGALKALRRELRRTLSATNGEAPQWALDLAAGKDEGFFAPGSAVWAVHGSVTTLVGGIRALLVQSLHPGALAGVDDFSMYRERPLVRLASTSRWIMTVTYGDKTSAYTACERILKLHERVRGTYTDARGETRSYYANDPDLLSWVHLAFVEAFLAAHTAYGKPIPGGQDQYVAEWAKAGELMQVPHPPRNRAELDEQLAAFRPELLHDAKVAEAVEFIRRPPLPRSQRLGYRILFAGAVETLEPYYLELLGLKKPSLGPFPLPVRAATRLVLAFVRLGLGRKPPSEISARHRISRLSQQNA